MTGQLADHFYRDEFQCKCGCKFDTVDAELINGPLNFLRTDNVRVTILSGCRCLEHNETVQLEENPDYVPYSSKSTHMDGKAADITVERQQGKAWVLVSPDEVATRLETRYPDRYGIGRYKTFTHIDVRSGGPARWDRR